MKKLNVGLIILGIALLCYGYIHWIVRHESPEVKTAVDILYIVPGWALLTMGFIGLQCMRGNNSK